MADYYFSGPKRAIARHLIFLSGVARSGTTLLGQLVGSLSTVEYEFEPMVLAHVPALVNAGLLDEEAAASLLAGAFDECLYERLMGRRVNLRPTDDSRFWLTKPYDELTRRWGQNATRKEMRQAVEAQRIWLAQKAPDLAPYYGFLLRTFRRSLLLNIVRNGFDVVQSNLDAGWYADGFVQDGMGRVPMRRVADGRVVSAWVEPDVQDSFLGWNEATRCLYKWRYLVEEAERHLAAADPARVLTIRYENLVLDPRSALASIQTRLEGAESTLETERILQVVDSSRIRHRAMDPKRFDPDEFERAWRLMQRLGYDDAMIDAGV